jgi:hypothetical protein
MSYAVIKVDETSFFLTIRVGVGVSVLIGELKTI